jgi:hypothetical protein
MIFDYVTSPIPLRGRACHLSRIGRRDCESLAREFVVLISKTFIAQWR